jgi:ATP-dependent Clp protease ATP-binding subunit ClpA
VIFAGYGDQMDTFFQANPGLRSRVAHHIEFPDFTADELMAIAELMVQEQQYELDDEARATLREYLMLRMRQAYFSNARSVRNAIDRAKLRQASRLVGQNAPVPARELSRIDAADIRASRVFRDAPPADGAE